MCACLPGFYGALCESRVPVVATESSTPVEPGTATVTQQQVKQVGNMEDSGGGGGGGEVDEEEEEEEEDKAPRNYQIPHGSSAAVHRLDRSCVVVVVLTVLCRCWTNRFPLTQR